MIIIDEHVNLCVFDEREVAYVITDAGFPFDFEIRSSANAWWMNRRKVELLIEGLKLGHLVKDACVLAGISEGQYKYFREVHPQFSTIQEACEATPTLIAMRTFMEGVAKDPQMAFKYLSRLHPKYKPAPVDGAGTALPSTVNIAVGNIDAGSLLTAIREIAREALPSRTNENPSAQWVDPGLAGDTEERPHPVQ